MDFSKNRAVSSMLLLTLLCAPVSNCLSLEATHQDHPVGPGTSPPRLPQKPEFKDYSNWSLVRLYPTDRQVVKEILRAADVSPDVRVLNVRRGKTYSEIDLALSPAVTLDQLMPSNCGRVQLCSLDGIAGGSGTPSASVPSSGDNPNVSYLDKLIKRHLNSGTGTISGASCSVPRNCGGNGDGEGERTKRSLGLLNWVTLLDDIGLSFFPPKTKQLSENAGLSWDNYYRYDSILQFAKNLSAQSSNAGFIQIGKSFEERDLFALVFATKPGFLVNKYKKKIGMASSLLATGGSRNTEEREKARKFKKWQPSGGKDSAKKKYGKHSQFGSTRNEIVKKKGSKKNTKPLIFIEAGIHAREWLSPAIATYVANQLAVAGNSFLKLVSVVLVPLANPDGYEYTHTYDRMWRKSRRTYNDTYCVGVDLNRNYDISWGDVEGASTDRCSEQYCGEGAFSEPETAALRDLAAVFLKDTKIYLSLHSYGQLVLYPWGYTQIRPPKFSIVKKMGLKLVKVLNKHSNYNFEGGQSSTVLYTSSGTSSDYMYSKGVTYSYTIELPNRSSFQFMPQAIQRAAEGFWSSLVCFVGEIVKTRKARSFCQKRIVTVLTENNVTVSGWVKKKVSQALAEKIVLEKHSQKLKKEQKLYIHEKH